MNTVAEPLLGILMSMAFAILITLSALMVQRKVGSRSRQQEKENDPPARFQMQTYEYILGISVFALFGLLTILFFGFLNRLDAHKATPALLVTLMVGVVMLVSTQFFKGTK